MASIRRPHSPARAQHLLRHNHPFATASPPSSPLRHASSAASAAAPSSSPRKPGYPHPFLFFSRRPLPRFAAFFLLGSFIGLLHLLSHLPLHHTLPSHSSSSPHPTHLHHHPQDQPMTQQQQQYLAALALRRTAVMHRYVGCCDALNASASPAVDFRPHQLNAGLEVVENHRLDGVVYFADEEGVYSLPLFDRLRQIRRFGTWPVPTISEGGHDVVLEGPVCKQNQVVGWHTSGGANKLQRFHVAMSGFAFNSTMLWDPRLRSHRAWNSIRHPEMVEQGFQGTTFVEQLVEDESQMEGIPADCSQIMNWHVPFGSESPVYPKGWRSAANLDVIIPLK
ncbi:hypothetical protein CFC21_014734 [Triticum aestivum]|uniref:Glycosyltransferases n=2 Tax=Triticum aestivum TaxID=4565 RepID=A0A9R1DUU6_WHEAT|nr:hypothetical protein CFC21_014734 [Triticum aestivum]